MVVIYVSLTILLASCYALLIIYILENWKSIPKFKSKKHPATIGLSIVIPARNEEQNISNCIQSIIDNKLDQLDWEILVIDDHSEDKTMEKIQSFTDERIKYISLQKHLEKIGGPVNAYKKAAINLGLEIAKHDYIVQLDADTVVPSKYFSTLHKFLSEKQPSFVAGPIMFSSANTLLEKFQQLDIIGMMAVTAAGIKSGSWYMANGANMIYKKTHHRFNNDDMASGDDVYTVQNIARQNFNSVFFLKNKNAIVQTGPMKSMRELYNQRVRWATKNKNMSGIGMKIMMLIPFVNALLIALHFVAYFYFGKLSFILLFFQLAVKCFSDYLMLKEVSAFFNQQKVLKSFLVCNIIHVFYILIIGVLSLFQKNYNWKGREVN